MKHVVSMTKILEAIKHYESYGFRLIDVPICVDRSVSALTKPESVPDLCHTGDDVYVGSAEQSFIQMYNDGNLPDGRYMALTPCYRHEGLLSDYSYLMFLKLELITVGKHETSFVLDCSMKYFSRYVRCTVTPQFSGLDVIDIETDEWDPRELGSYGSRYMPDGKEYTFGTGIAEPRLSSIINNPETFE